MFRVARPLRVLQPFHYLQVHDALVALYPSCSIKAFTEANKVHMFQTDMVCQLPNYERDEVVEHVQRLQNKLLATELSEVNNLVDIRFHDKEVMTLTFGVTGVTIEQLNDEPSLLRRQLLRESLGGSEELFLQFLDDTVLRAADYLAAGYANTLQIPTVDLPPRYYFAAHILKAVRQRGIANDFDYAAQARHNINAKSIQRPSAIITPFDNPYCPGEDWNTLPIIKEFLEVVEGKE